MRLHEPEKLGHDLCTRVLIVADQPATARSWTQIVARHEHASMVVDGALAALECFADWPRRAFDVVLVEDDRLREGIALVPIVNALSPRPSAALVSAAVTTRRWLEASRAGVALIPKPRNDGELLGLLAVLRSQNQSASANPDRYRSLPRSDDRRALALRANGEVTADGIAVVRLRRAEARLLGYMVSHAGQPITAFELAARVFDRSDSRALDLVRRHIANLRKALGPLRDIVVSAPALGYEVCGRWTDIAAYDRLWREGGIAPNSN